MDPDKLRRDFLTMDMPDEQLRILMLQALGEAQAAAPKKIKVGRNDPCPCGSGKKYKNAAVDGQGRRGLFENQPFAGSERD